MWRGLLGRFVGLSWACTLGSAALGWFRLAWLGKWKSALIMCFSFICRLTEACFHNYGKSTSDQIRSDQSLSRVQLFATPWIAARQASLSITNSQSSPRLTSIKSVMPSIHLILCHPLLLLPPIPPSIRVFSNESSCFTLGQTYIKYVSSSEWQWNKNRVFNPDTSGNKTGSSILFFIRLHSDPWFPQL